MKIVLTILFTVLLISCASMNTPKASLIDTVPVVKIGDAGDTPEDHIVFIPANTDFLVQFSLKGTIFNNDVSSTIMASFKQDLYLYKYWASLDGKKWVNSHKLLNVKPSGGFDKSGGKIEVKLDLVQ
ncbi:MAG: hypothetical protein RPU64_04800 [Candidatus Sedimenticola sp. (ex Thyasira tokunagai)]